MAGVRWTRKKVLIAALAAVGVAATLAVPLGGAISAFLPQRAEPAPTAAPAPTSTTPAVTMAPLAVRPVNSAYVSTPEQCAALAPLPPPDRAGHACDLDRRADYDLGPVALTLALTGARTVRLPGSTYSSVTLAMDPASGAAFREFTAANVGRQLAFVRNGTVLAAPKIDQPIDGQSIQLSGDMTPETAQAILGLLRDGS